MPWSQASLNQEGSLEARSSNQLAGGPSGGFLPQPHSHLVQHLGYGKAAAQVLETGAMGRNLEGLQLRREEKGNAEIRGL